LLLLPDAEMRKIFQDDVHYSSLLTIH
jgi:hypothetical protein